MNNRILEKIKSAENIAIACHKSPDADTVGSALALYWALKPKKNVELVCKDAIAPNLLFLKGAQNFKREIPYDTDLVIAVDVGSLKKLSLDTKDAFIVCIDHHQSNEEYANLSLVDPSKASTGEIMFDFLLSCGFHICESCATSLCASIASDSRFFTTNRTNCNTFSVVSSLCNMGADYEKVVRNLQYSYSHGTMELFGRVLSNFKLYEEVHLIVGFISKEDLEQTKTHLHDTSEIADFLLYHSSCDVSLLLVEHKDGLKGSLRSCAKVDVLRLARALSGGGHKHAAGFFTDVDMPQILDILLRALSAKKNN